MVIEVCRVQNGQMDGLSATTNSENIASFVIELSRRLNGNKVDYNGYSVSIDLLEKSFCNDKEINFFKLGSSPSIIDFLHSTLTLVLQY